VTEQTIFTAVLELDSSERTAFLDEACDDNNQLRERVEKLLRLHAEAGVFLDRPGGAIGITVDQRVAERPGMEIGP
jgi:hypothetical protein